MEPAPEAPRAPRSTTLTPDELEKWDDKDQALLEALEEWRERTAEARWGANHFVGGFGILPDDHVDRLVRLARRGILITPLDLQREIKWHYHTQYNNEVLAVIHSIYPRALPTSNPTRHVVAASQTGELSSGSSTTTPTPIRKP